MKSAVVWKGFASPSGGAHDHIDDLVTGNIRRQSVEEIVWSARLSSVMN